MLNWEHHVVVSRMIIQLLNFHLFYTEASVECPDIRYLQVLKGIDYLIHLLLDNSNSTEGPWN